MATRTQIFRRVGSSTLRGRPRLRAAGGAAGEDSIVMVTSVIHCADSWAGETHNMSVDPQGAEEMVTVPSNFRTGYLYTHLLYR